MLEFAAQQAALQALHNGHHFHGKPHQRHSLHTTVIETVPLSAREGSQLEITTHRVNILKLGNKILCRNVTVNCKKIVAFDLFKNVLFKIL